MITRRPANKLIPRTKTGVPCCPKCQSTAYARVTKDEVPMRFRCLKCGFHWSDGFRGVIYSQNVSIFSDGSV